MYDECDSVTPNQTSSANQFSMTNLQQLEPEYKRYPVPKLTKAETAALLVPTLLFPPAFFVSMGLIVINKLRKNTR